MTIGSLPTFRDLLTVYLHDNDSVAMALRFLSRGFIFVDSRDRVNSQIGDSNIPDHHLTRLPDAMMPHVVPGLSTRESPAVYADSLPIIGRFVFDKDGVRN